MIQDILVYIIIALALLKTIYSIVKLIMPAKKTQEHACKGCSGCSVLELKGMNQGLFNDFITR